MRKNALDRKHPEIGAFEFYSCLWIDKMERIKTVKEREKKSSTIRWKSICASIAVTANICKIIMWKSGLMCLASVICYNDGD